MSDPTIPNRVKDKPVADTIASDDWTLLDSSTLGVRKFSPHNFALRSEITSEGGAAPLQVPSIAALRAFPVAGLIENTLIDVLGYYSPGDGGGGQFRFTASVAEDGNNGTVIPPNSGTGRWLRIVNDLFSIKAFGASPAVSASINTAAFNTAIQYFAQGGTIFVPCGTYQIAGGLTWGSSIASLIGEGRYSIIQCTAQTGAIIDISISSLVSNFQFSQQIAHLYLLGDQVADPTKTHCGIRLHGAVTCISFHDLTIAGTGGPCLKLETESDCCSFKNLGLSKPIGAFANNVPWVHLYGVSNGNVFENVILREATSTELSGIGGCIRLEMDPNGLGPGNPYSPNQNKFIGCQSEYIHMPPGGSIVHCDGRNNDFDHFIDYDSDASGTLLETTDTCIIRFPANATFPIGGNLVRGVLPGTLASATGRPGFVFAAHGIIISSNGNHIEGVSGGYPNTVLLTAGATRNYICLAGTSHATYANLIVDNSAAANAIINTVPTGNFQISRIEDLQANKLQVGTGFSSAIPTQFTGVDGPISAIVASVQGTSAGAFLHFSDLATAHCSLGINTGGWFCLFQNRSPGLAGIRSISVTDTANLLVGLSSDIAGTNGLGVLNNIEVVTVGKGFILKSPDGTRYRIQVANGGALSTTPA